MIINYLKDLMKICVIASGGSSLFRSFLTAVEKKSFLPPLVDKLMLFIGQLFRFGYHSKVGKNPLGELTYVSLYSGI